MPPSLSQITANFFVNLITRLGVRPPPDSAFLLSNVVQPVTIVDTDIAIPAVTTTQLLDGAFSQGVQAAPGAAVLLADTGPQVAGNYNVLILVGSPNAAGGGTDYIVERRNAANAANIWRQVGSLTNGTQGVIVALAFQAKLLLNERIRVETSTGGTGAIEVNIFLTPVS